MCVSRLTMCVLVLVLSTGARPEPAAAFQEFLFFHQDLPEIPGSATYDAHFGQTLAAGDFNGDGFLDLAIAIPREDVGVVENAGAVHVLYGSAAGPGTTGLQEWHQDVAGVEDACEAGDFFGSSLAAGDFNRDGYDDLAVGVPLEDIGTVAAAGGVHILSGSPSGLTAAGSQFWNQDNPDIAGGAEVEARLGSSLTTGDFNGDGYADLAIGIPGDAYIPFMLPAVPKTGAVTVIFGSSTGLSAAGSQYWSQGLFNVEDDAETYDWFGDALVAGDFNGDGYDDLAIGVPGEGIGTSSIAGAVNVLYGTASGLSSGGNQFWHQDTPGIDDASEEYDYFGSSLAAGDFNGDGFQDLAIGALLEDLASAFDAGVVHILYGTASGLSATGSHYWTQDSAGMLDAVESWDNFGGTLAAYDFNSDGYDDLAIGVDGEAIGTIDRAGAVSILFGGASGLSAAGNQMWHQDSAGVADEAETWDYFGDALAAGDFDGDGAADLAIGVYGEDRDTISNAGLVHVFLSGLSRLVYPHIDATGSWATEVCAINNSGSVVSGTFNAFDAAGKRIGSPHPVTLAAHGRSTLYLKSIYTWSASIKYITLVHDGGDGVVGYTKFTTPGQYRAALPASPAAAAGDLYVSHIASDPTWWTGIGLVNLTGLTKNLTLRFNTGVTKTVTLPPHGQTAFLMRDLFGGAAQPALASAVIEDAVGMVGLELFGQGNQLGGIRLSNETATTLFFPHIHSDAEWWTGLAAYNPHVTATNLTITPYSAAGGELTSQSIPVGAKGKYVGLVESLSLPAGTAWIKVTASQPVTGVELFGTNDEKLLAGFTALNLTRTSGVFPKIDTAGWTGIALVNTTGSAVTVTLKAYRDNGTVVATASLPLAGFAKTLGYVEDLFSGSNISAATSMGFTASGPVAGFQLNGSADGWLLDGLPGM